MEIYYSNHISWQLLDDTIYIIDEITQKVYSLQNVAKDFWVLIKDNHLLEEIIQILGKKYDVSKDIIASDVNEFKDTLLAEKLLVKGESYYE